MIDKHFMREALKEATIARDGNNWAIGCVIVFEGKIIARGHNEVYSSKNRLAHAEIQAITELQAEHFEYTDKDLTLYTTFEPCPMCFGAILMSGIRHVVSGVNFDKSGATASIEHMPLFFTQPRFKTTLTTGILAKECAQMWATSWPAEKYVASGSINMAEIEKLADETQIYVTPVLAPIDWHLQQS